MSPELFLTIGLNPALALLPEEMDSVRAKAFVLCVCFQESNLEHRRQGGGGPARGYGQFEKSGVFGVLSHHQSAPHAQEICAVLDIKPLVTTVYAAIEFNDVLAAAFARLLIWTLPDELPRRGQADESYGQYLSAWRPGKPRPETWPAAYARAWEIVEPVHNHEGEPSS